MRIRPIDVYSEAHVRGNVFLCMLGYYMEWHLKRELAPLLFIYKHKDKGKAKRTTPVGKAQVSDSAIKKQNSRTTELNFPPILNLAFKNSLHFGRFSDVIFCCPDSIYRVVNLNFQPLGLDAWILIPSRSKARFLVPSRP